MRPFTLARVACLTVFLGCSSTSGGGSGVDGGTPGDGSIPSTLTIDNFASAYYAAICTALFQCPTAGDNGTAVALFQNTATCTRLADRLAGGPVEDLIGLVRAGRIRFDGAAARTCLTALSTTCSFSSGAFEQTCRGTFTGTQATGAGCWRSEECAQGNWCDHGDSTPRQCPGTCRAQGAAGVACTTGRQCMGWDTGAADCSAGNCAAVQSGAPVGENQSCGLIMGAAPTRVPCMSGFVCAGGMCKRPIMAGAPCTSGDPCAPGTLCVQRIGTTTRTCTTGDAVVRSTPGGTCSPNGRSDFFCNPLAGLTCNAMNTCELLGDGSMGSRCAPGGDFNAATCALGLRCDPATSRCVARLASGSACSRGADCLSGACENDRCIDHVCN